MSRARTLRSEAYRLARSEAAVATQEVRQHHVAIGMSGRVWGFRVAVSMSPLIPYSQSSSVIMTNVQDDEFQPISSQCHPRRDSHRVGCIGSSLFCDSSLLLSIHLHDCLWNLQDG